MHDAKMSEQHAVAAVHGVVAHAVQVTLKSLLALAPHPAKILFYVHK